MKVVKPRPQPKFDFHLIEKGASLILRGLGADVVNDRNFIETPERYARALAEMFLPEDKGWAVFPEDYNDFILLRDHLLWSLCPHHLLPVKLYVSVAYIPNRNVLGLSKLARLCDDCNRGPLLQEAFTKAVLDQLYRICRGVRGAACLVEGRHGCMEMRGVRSNAHFLTYSFRGEFEANERLQDRFIAMSRTLR